MKCADIFQTLENRNNDADVENHGPFFCSSRYQNGEMKKGIKEPWLGEGYYFWDTRIEDAKWWGETIYGKMGYIICHTTYDQHSSLLYDLVGDLRQLDDFIKCARFIKQRNNTERISFASVLAYLKKSGGFCYKAIRVWPLPKHLGSTGIFFSGNITALGDLSRTQICFFDKTLLTEPYQIVYKEPACNTQTI